MEPVDKTVGPLASSQIDLNEGRGGDIVGDQLLDLGRRRSRPDHLRPNGPKKRAKLADGLATRQPGSLVAKNAPASDAASTKTTRRARLRTKSSSADALPDQGPVHRFARRRGRVELERHQISLD
jgi:hypothetical protein